MPISLKMFLKSALITFLLFIITFLIFGVFYEEYEVLFDAFYSGKMSPGTPFYSWYFMANIGISYAYAELYRVCDKIEWMSVVLYLYIYISASLILYLVNALLKGKVSNRLILFAQLFVFALIISENIVHFQFTRVAYLTCAASLFTIIFCFRDFASIRSHLSAFLGLNVLFMLGTLTRSESSMAVVCLLLPFALLLQRNFSQLLRIFVLPCSFLLIVLAGIFYDIGHSHDFYKRVEPDIEIQLSCRENHVDIGQMKNARDSLKYEAALHMLWGDPNVMTPTFMRSLIAGDSAFLRDSRQWQRVTETLKGIVLNYRYLILFNFLLALVFITLNHKKLLLPDKIIWLLYLLSFWVIIAAQTYFYKINDRSFFPLFSMYLAGTIFLLLYYSKEPGRIWKAIIISGGTLVVLLECVSLGQGTTALKEERKNYQWNMAILQKTVGHHTLVLNASSFRFFLIVKPPFVPYDFSSFDRVYINEAQVLPTVHTYHEYLEKECHCDIDDFSNFFRYLRGSDRQVYFLSSPYRMDLIRRYLAGIHQYDLDIKEVAMPGFRQVYDHEMANVLDLKLYTFVPKTGN